MRSRFLTKWFDKAGEEISYCQMAQLIKRDCKIHNLNVVDVTKAIKFYEDEDSDNYFKRNYFLEYPEIVGYFNRRS